MRRLIFIIIAVIFIVMFIPLAIVMIMSNFIDNSKPFDTPETAVNISVYIAGEDKVCDMDESTYLSCVVAGEMPVDFEFEALKAQAVAARTYLASHMYEYKSGNKAEEHKGAVICTESSHCQAYVSESDFKQSRENADEKWDKICRAVKETSGMVMTYKGKPISAVFFSTSSGKTENAEDVWDKAVPYLKSVKSEGDELSPRYSSEAEFAIEDFKKTAEENIEGIDWNKCMIGKIKRTEANGIKTIEIGGIKVKGTEFRKIYSLRSTNAEVTEDGDKVKISVKGFGHDVGMSQYGANYMASNGADYKKILKKYYSGITITQQ